MAAHSSKHAKKRRRGPYLSYLTNPLKEEIPRTTLQSWSRESHEKNVIGNKKESCSRECVMIDEGTSIVEEKDDLLNSDEASDSSSNNVEETSGNESLSEGTFTTIVGEQLVSDAVDMNSLECPNIETASDPDDFLHLSLCEDEIAFADDCDEETWEDSWEEDENFKDSTKHEENQNSSHADGDQQEQFLLYPGAKITLGMSMLLIITFSMRHQLSGTALADLLTLIDLHLIAPNCFTRSMTTLHKFFKQLKNPVQFHYYCSFCYEYIGIHKRPCCTNKHCLQDLTKKNGLSYFIVIPLEPQL